MVAADVRGFLACWRVVVVRRDVEERRFCAVQGMASTRASMRMKCFIGAIIYFVVWQSYEIMLTYGSDFGRLMQFTP